MKKVVTIQSHEGRIDLSNKQMAVMLSPKCDKDVNSDHQWRIEIKTRCGAKVTLYFDDENNKKYAFEVLDQAMKGQNITEVLTVSEIHMD